MCSHDALHLPHQWTSIAAVYSSEPHPCKSTMKAESVLFSLLPHPREGLTHSSGSMNPCRNGCMTELKQRVQGILKAGDSKTNGGHSDWKGKKHFLIYFSKSWLEYKAVFSIQSLIVALLWYKEGNTDLTRLRLCHYLLNLCDRESSILASVSFLWNRAMRIHMPGLTPLWREVMWELVCPMKVGTHDKGDKDKSTHCILAPSAWFNF